MKRPPVLISMEWRRAKMDGSGYSPVNESQVVAPSRMLAMGDGVMGWDGTYRDSAMFGRTSTAWDELDSTVHVKRRHGGTLNVLFCDGHVTPLPLEFLFADKTAPALSQWNRDNEPHAERTQ